MRAESRRWVPDAIAIAIAALACLQPGIDPVFLTLLSAAHGIDPTLHGWIVGATQGGMAVGAVIVWRYGTALPARLPGIAGGVALLCAIATAQTGGVGALLIVRALFGFSMGILYTDAMSAAAVRRPTSAYAAVFLTQLVLSTAVAFALPPVARAAGPHAALLALALVPCVAAALALGLPVRGRSEAASGPAEDGRGGAAPPAAWALATATFAFICATMMVWSFAGALAIDHGLGEDAIGLAVALGSIAGAVTALAVMRGRLLVPLPLTGLFASLCLLAPPILTPSGERWLFVGAILLLNVGSTAIIIRCSAAATAAGETALFRRLVACTHPLGMIAGPVAGSVLTTVAGHRGLEAGAIVALATGCGALLVAARRPGRRATDAAVTAITRRARMRSEEFFRSSPRSRLDRIWTYVKTWGNRTRGPAT